MTLKATITERLSSARAQFAKLLTAENRPDSTLPLEIGALGAQLAGIEEDERRQAKREEAAVQARRAPNEVRRRAKDAAEAKKAADQVRRQRDRVEAEILATDEKIAALRPASDDQAADALAEAIATGDAKRISEAEARAQAEGTENMKRRAEAERFGTVREALERRAEALAVQERELREREHQTLAEAALAAQAALRAQWDLAVAPLERLAAVMIALDDVSGAMIGGALLHALEIPRTDGVPVRVSLLRDAVDQVREAVRATLLRGELPQ